MWLVLCSPADRPALRAVRGLLQRGLTPIEAVSAEALLLAPFWDHRILVDGAATSTVRLHDGRTIEHTAVRGVLCRIGALPGVPIGASAPDEAYIRQERAALLLSWLASLRNVINEPTPQGLAGAWRPPAHTQWLAAAAGLPVFPERYRGPFESGDARPTGLPRASVVVFDGKVYGSRMPEPLCDACAAYARLSRTRLSGLDFVRAYGDWVFEAETPMPDLAIGGAALLDALAAALSEA